MDWNDWLNENLTVFYFNFHWQLIQNMYTKLYNMIDNVW